MSRLFLIDHPRAKGPREYAFQNDETSWFPITCYMAFQISGLISQRCFHIQARGPCFRMHATMHQSSERLCHVSGHAINNAQLPTVMKHERDISQTHWKLIRSLFKPKSIAFSTAPYAGRCSGYARWPCALRALCTSCSPGPSAVLSERHRSSGSHVHPPISRACRPTAGTAPRRPPRVCPLLCWRPDKPV